MATIQPIKTPAGELKWVNISGEGKENLSGKFKFVADLVLPADDEGAIKLKEMIDAFWKENKPANFRKKAKSLGYRMEMEKVLDEDGNETYNDDDEVVYRETGNIKFSFATDTTWAKSGDPKIINIFNAKGSKVSLGDKKIGNGSIGNVGGAMGIYEVKDKGKLMDAGVTLYLNSIRILKLVEFTNEEQWDDAGDGWTGEDNWDSEGGAEDTPADNKPAPRL